MLSMTQSSKRKAFSDNSPWVAITAHNLFLISGMHCTLQYDIQASMQRKDC